MNYGFVLGAVVLAILVAMITNWVMDYTNEGFTMDPSSKFKALLNYVEFDNDNGQTILRTKVPLVVDNKVRVNNKGEAGGIQLQPRNTNAYSRLLVGDRGDIGVVGHYSDAGAGTDMPVFGVDKYNGPTLVNVATTGRGANVKVSGTWPDRSWRFNPNYLINDDLQKFHHSRNNRNAWNDVYLNKMYPIHKLTLVNIHAPSRLQTPILELYEGNKVVHKTTMDVKGNRDYSLDLKGIRADRIRIINPDNYLNLANLKIFTKE
jgi:hypothetical protein